MGAQPKYLRKTINRDIFLDNQSLSSCPTGSPSPIACHRLCQFRRLASRHHPTGTNLRVSYCCWLCWNKKQFNHPNSLLIRELFWEVHGKAGSQRFATCRRLLYWAEEVRKLGNRSDRDALAVIQKAKEVTERCLVECRVGDFPSTLEPFSSSLRLTPLLANLESRKSFACI